MLEGGLLLDGDRLVVLHYRRVRRRESVESVDHIGGNSGSEALYQAVLLGDFPALIDVSASIDSKASISRTVARIAFLA